MINQELASLITYAFHDPQKMPDYTKAGQGGKPRKSSAQSVEQLRAALIGMHHQSKGER